MELLTTEREYVMKLGLLFVVGTTHSVSKPYCNYKMG